MILRGKGLTSSGAPHRLRRLRSKLPAPRGQRPWPRESRGLESNYNPRKTHVEVMWNEAGIAHVCHLSMPFSPHLFCHDLPRPPAMDPPTHHVDAQHHRSKSQPHLRTTPHHPSPFASSIPTSAREYRPPVSPPLILEKFATMVRYSMCEQ
jgi:hypothetical protein